ncbi:TetR/AcrR family transcriptional regulator [Deinococcus sp.]|uniref:TetR/AcrR family transcriptional regulator n=1 Tax=Deinococcus sp. TaxID=47478 RepID=UPI003C7D8C3D
MVTRTEAAATTRRALIAAAAELLDRGGPDAVTLRAVGARAGVSRGAPYGHFEDKAHLLTELATESWTRLAGELETLHGERELTAPLRLERALGVLVNVGRRQPHLYAQMCRTPAGDPQAAAQAASQFQQAFVAIVAELVGEQGARRYAALLLLSAHGVAGMELSGELSHEKWDVTGDELVVMLVAAVAAGALP